MRMGFSLTQSAGVSAFIHDNGEFVAAWLMSPAEDAQDIKKKLQENKVFPVMDGASPVARINPSTCFIDKEEKVDSHWKGIQFLLINNRASTKSATLDKQYFLVPKDIEDKMSYLKTQFFNKNIKKLPLPVHQDWEEFFWEDIMPFFKELQDHGNPPYKGYMLALPSIEIIQNLVEKTHAKAEFKARFNRVPRLDSLFVTCDIDSFDFKQWQSFIQSKIGGQETFEKMSQDHQKAAVRAFEIFGDSALILPNINIFHTLSLRPVNIFLRLTKDKGQKARIKQVFEILFDQYKDNKEYLYPSISNFENLYKEQAHNITAKNFTPVEKYLSQIKYENVSDGCDELAFVCGAAKVSQHEFKLFEALYLKYFDSIMVAPRSFPTIDNEFGPKASWEVLDMSVPRAWVVGIETYCCMHPTSVGGACLEYAAKNPETSGVLRVAEKGKTIAQSFVWMSEPDERGYRVLVLDNIETAGNNIRDIVKQAYIDFGEKMEYYARLFKIKSITIGTGYSDMTLSEFCIEKLSNTSNLYAQKPASLGYYDAREQWLFKKFI